MSSLKLVYALSAGVSIKDNCNIQNNYQQRPGDAMFILNFQGFNRILA